MGINIFFNKLINAGIKDNYQAWEIHLTKKLNSIVLIGIFNMIMGILFFKITNNSPFIPYCLFGLLSLPFVIVLNTIKNYVLASYWFYCCGFTFFILVNLKMGIHSYVILFYFPVIISMVQLLGRKETFKHLIALSAICILSILSIVIEFKFNMLGINSGTPVSTNLILFNILLSFITTIALTIVLVFESVSQEKLIRKTLTEKEILLAEVFHRVKNNMNIVTSLLNLKKNMSDSIEVQNALEECRSRIYSMALVHQMVFNNDNLVRLNFNEYIKNLTVEIAKSLGDIDKFEIILETDDVNLELSKAIPCGLILNELLTNSFKYGKPGNNKLEIHIKLKNKSGEIELEVRDNGPGMTEAFNTKTLGHDLIQSLSEQINGSFRFYNKDGFVFNVKFKAES